MDKILRLLSQKIVSSEEDISKVKKYHALKEHPGWQVHLEYLAFLRGLVAIELLGDRFTNLDPIRKDVAQRAYAMVDKLVLFLVDPMAEAQKTMQIKRHNERMGATFKGSDQKGK